MIKITATGDTYQIKHTLGSNGFDWSPKSKEWTRIVSESSLDQTLDSITPEIVEINIRLQKVDVHGNPLSPDIMKFCLNDVERPGVSVSELFSKGVSVSSVSPVHSSGPIKKNSKKWKELPSVDEGFF